MFQELKYALSCALEAAETTKLEPVGLGCTSRTLYLFITSNAHGRYLGVSASIFKSATNFSALAFHTFTLPSCVPQNNW
jgi:hypothetical protein